VPRLRHILETALYVADVDRSERFYCDLFGCRTIMADDRLRVLRLTEDQVLLLFKRGGSVTGSPTPRGFIPEHDGQGTLHVAFAIGDADVDDWRHALQTRAIPIISEVRPQQGGVSLYFRDPDGHLIELATPSIWDV
jgi:catechol 2,3-dioxygenase-like lactoylglutathione lyase family enzyme